VKSATYRPLYKQFFWLFVVTCVLLGWLGSKPPEGGYVILSRLLTAWYFIHFIIVLPLLGLVEKPKPLPTSISEAVLGTKKAAAAVALAVALGAAALIGAPQPASAQEHEEAPPPRNAWSFAGPFGKFDPGQLQRGFKVYHDVCQTCHSLALLSFGNLGEEGGPHFSEAEVAALAAEYMVKDGPNDQGDMFDRPARPADHFPPPFANEQLARFANSGSLPPDMSVLAKARQFERGFPWFVMDVFVPYQELGVDYIVALLKGYAAKPADMTMPAGMQYNTAFPGHAIGMPPPLTDGRVDYTDGSPQTVDQYAKDVAAFLMWAAEPSLDTRKRTGFQVLIFLVVLTGLLYFSKKKVWAAAH
jgi:ubiquinol-cytochrome c reductase cytochrome b/c1 subunit